MKLVGRRLSELFIFLIALSFISFVFMKLAPGDPVKLMLQVDDLAVTQEEMESLQTELGLDQPVYVQYANWLSRFFQLDFGNSYITKQPVIEELAARIPSTLALTFSSLVVMMLIAVPLGTLSALYKNRWIDHISRLFAIAGASIPSFWLGLIFIQLFSVKYGLFPSMGKGSLFHLVLPSLTLGLAMAAVYVRLLRSSLLESFGQDFITSARARGLSSARIFWLHAFRHALAPVVTIFGVSLGSLLGGTVIIEVLFAYPGVGQLIIDSIVRRDYPVIQGYILFMGIFVALINILVDISYRFLNPDIAIKEMNNR
ncbi:ABC transporter permease subunit [Bacillus lacus]|uniref:Nickel import system permease protein NikB n=1 Tax=Metabacillus lacus TaxID=1983721 RepID=A0A7X2IZ14_9BACI|nr:nickel ABC transporter permease [Metabacillus lacus]MRX72407.1 ABC transporter permease subunit [Metabacillus lacus]